jgi:hypothetical protein
VICHLQSDARWTEYAAAVWSDLTAWNIPVSPCFRNIIALIFQRAWCNWRLHEKARWGWALSWSGLDARTSWSKVLSVATRTACWYHDRLWKSHPIVVCIVLCYCIVAKFIVKTSTILKSTEVWGHVMTDGQSVSQYVLGSSPLWDLQPNINSVWILLSCFCWAPSLTRSRVYLLLVSQQ